MEKQLKTYMAYSRALGSDECAVLVFAHSSREAKKVAAKEGVDPDIADGFTDIGIRRIEGDWLMAEANPKKDGQPHVIWDPKSCSVCERWGQSPIGDDGLCDDCRRDASNPEVG